MSAGLGSRMMISPVKADGDWSRLGADLSCVHRQNGSASRAVTGERVELRGPGAK